MKWSAVLLALVVLSGCTSLRIDMGPYYAPPSCSLTVEDRRPDTSTIVGSDIDFTISPPLAEVLRSKLCRSATVSNYLVRNKMKVFVSRVEIFKFGFVGTDKMLTMEGSVETGIQRLAVVSNGKVGLEGMPYTWWPLLLNSTLDDFVIKVEDTINSQK